MAANDLVTLEECKLYLTPVISNNASDDVLLLLITQCSAWAQQYCNDAFLQAEYDHVVSGWGSNVLPLPYGPLVSVRSLHIDDTEIFPRGSVGAYGYSINVREQAIRLSGSRFSQGDNNIEVFYTAGYLPDDIPADLKLAVIRLVAHRYAERKHIGITSEGIQGQSISYQSEAAPADVTRTLDQYKRLNPVC